MSVKRSRSASRVLRVLETLAYHQPVGVSELARIVGDDKSAVQRALMTLADSGWISAVPGRPTRWQLTARILTIANAGNINNDLRQRARGSLERLRIATGESVLLTVPEGQGFVVIDVLESDHLVRSVPHVGMYVPPVGSATSRAVLPYLPVTAQQTVLGEAPDAAMRREFARVLKRGYAVSAGDVTVGSTNIAAPILEADSQPVGALVVSAPSDRLTRARYAEVGALVLDAARSVSRGERSYQHQG